MEPFDLPSEPEDLPAATLEELLTQAAQDPAYRPEFYRRLLLEPLLVVVSEDPAVLAQAEPDTAGSDRELIMIESLPGRRTPIFTSPDRMFDQGETRELAYRWLKGRVLLEMLRDHTLLLNPYSEFGKEFPPAEIARILDGTIVKDGLTMREPEEMHVLLGPPPVYPTALTQAVARLLSQQPRVRAAYLGWMDDLDSPEPPHYIICLDVEGEAQNIMNEASFVAQQFLQPGELIIFMPAGDNEFMDYFRQTEPFYED